MALSRAIAPTRNSQALYYTVGLASTTKCSSHCPSSTRIPMVSSTGNEKFCSKLGNRTWRSTRNSVDSRKHVICLAIAPTAETEEVYAMGSPKMKELTTFLEKDLPHLFDEQGIDTSMYDDKVDFVDPITKYNNIGGYLFNIQMLRRLFGPIFELHTVKQTSPTEITTRWTMTMTFVLLPWRPRLIFTGTSVMTVNPETGRFKSHVDYWDSIKNNDYFSFEGVQDVLRQLQIYKTPDLETPKYRVLKRTAAYEVRRYEQFLVAETPSDQLVGNKGFNEVASFLFGKNTTGEKMKMTTPVFNQAAGEGSSLQFVLPLNCDLSSVPGPLSENVKLRAVDKTFAAATKFNGQATEELIREKESALRSALIRDGLQPEKGYLLARYNDPGRTNPLLRRNEVIIWLQDFKLEV